MWMEEGPGVNKENSRGRVEISISKPCVSHTVQHIGVGGQLLFCIR